MRSASPNLPKAPLPLSPSWRGIKGEESVFFCVLRVLVFLSVQSVKSGVSCYWPSTINSTDLVHIFFSMHFLPSVASLRLRVQVAKLNPPESPVGWASPTNNKFHVSLWHWRYSGFPVENNRQPVINRPVFGGQCPPYC